MRALSITCLAAFFLIILGLKGSETLTDILEKRLILYNQENPSTNLFLHLDKSIYSQNEDIWFKAYVLAGEVVDSKVLYVRLTNDKKEVVLTEQFPMYDTRSNGDVLLSDTLQDGNYYLYAYTDRMINFKESDVFVQNIKVQRNAAKRLEASAFITDTTNIKRGQKVEVLVKLKEGIYLQKNVRGKYELLDDKKVLKNGRITTNLFGEASINFTYPQLADDKSLKVRVLFNRNSDYAELVLNLRHEKSPLKIKVYPEGGNLLYGVKSKVIIEALDINKNPVNTELSLLQNNKEIKRFKTSNYGIGSVEVKPIANSTYSIKYTNQNKESITYPIKTEEKGYSLAVRSTGERLIASITNVGDTERGTLVFRTLNQVLHTMPIKVPVGDSIVIPFIFRDIPKSIVSVLVLDEKGNVRCERLVLNKPRQEDYKVTVSTLERSYGSRKRITGNIEVTDANGDPVLANLSVAVIEKSRIDPDSYRNILNSYYYRFLDGTNCNRYISANIENDIDDLLITKQWTNNSSQHVLNYISQGQRSLLENTGGINGAVIPRNKGTSDLKHLTIAYKERGKIENGAIVVVNKDNTFSISPETLLTERGKIWKLKANQDFFSNYQVRFTSYDQEFDQCITRGDALFIPATFNLFASNKPVEVTKAANERLLKTVVIKGKENSEETNSRLIRQIECDAVFWVCRNNIYKCVNHPDDRYPPHEGEIYYSPFGPVMAGSCEPTNLTIKNIIKPKIFRFTDFELEKAEQPEVETTIYWNPNLNTAANGKQSFSFFSNDLKSDFLIIAQGIDIKTSQPVFGKTIFSVK